MAEKENEEARRGKRRLSQRRCSCTCVHEHFPLVAASDTEITAKKSMLRPLSLYTGYTLLWERASLEASRSFNARGWVWFLRARNYVWALATGFRGTVECRKFHWLAWLRSGAAHMDYSHFCITRIELGKWSMSLCFVTA